MISVKEDDIYTEFKTKEDKLAKLKEWGLISAKATTITKPFIYKGYYTKYPTQCDIIGYTQKQENSSYQVAVILVNNSKHKIVPEYLKQMQSNSFKIGAEE